MSGEPKSFLYSKYKTLQPARSRDPKPNYTEDLHTNTLKRSKNNGVPGSSISSNPFMQHSKTTNRTSKGTDFNSKLGTGFSTVPSNVLKTRQVFDPLNNVNRFKKQPGSLQGEPSNNFDFYRSHRQSSILEHGTEFTYAPADSNLLVNRFTKSSPARKSVSFAPSAKNVSSRLLSPEENRLVSDILGNEKQILAVSIGRILLPNINMNSWEIKGSTGVICLTKDSKYASYCFALVSLHTRNVLFRYELVQNLEYFFPKGNFLVFQKEESIAALLFADALEAVTFCKVLNKELNAEHIENNVLRQPMPMPKMTQTKNTLRRHVLI